MTTITLKKQITLGGKTINEVSLREPTLADMKKFSKAIGKGTDELEVLSQTLADLSGLSMAEIDELGMEDSAKLFKTVNDFFKPFEELANSKG